MDCLPVLRALGEINRMRIVRLLLKKQMSVNEISESLAMSQYNVSKHLKLLRAAQLVDMEPRGKLRLYTVAPSLKSKVGPRGDVLELDCCTFRFDRLLR